MKEVVITSGKGGTGKTSLVASFATLGQPMVLADCDVDAADLHLVLKPEVRKRTVFTSSHEAVIRTADCNGCGLCASYCRFDAIRLSSVSLDGSSPAAQRAFRVDGMECEGCGVCVRFCPQDAIDFPERTCGEWMVSDTRTGPMVHARLDIGAENSGKLVTMVRTEAQRMAKERESLLLVDGSPGIGCPVIASVTGATFVLVITEPTVSGRHDMERLLELTRHFRVPAGICINKWDINAELSAEIEARAESLDLPVVGRIRYDRSVTSAQVEGRSVVEGPDSPVAGDIREVYGRLMELV
jgi:MinD superfamily P-loop ATPase